GKVTLSTAAYIDRLRSSRQGGQIPGHTRYVDRVNVLLCLRQGLLDHSADSFVRFEKRSPSFFRNSLPEHHEPHRTKSVRSTMQRGAHRLRSLTPAASNGQGPPGREWTPEPLAGAFRTTATSGAASFSSCTSSRASARSRIPAPATTSSNTSFSSDSTTIVAVGIRIGSP